MLEIGLSLNLDPYDTLTSWIGKRAVKGVLVGDGTLTSEQVDSLYEFMAEPEIESQIRSIFSSETFRILVEREIKLNVDKLKNKNLFYNDNSYEAVHANRDHWIDEFGFGNNIDNLLSLFTRGNSEHELFRFSTSNKVEDNYVVWMWMGDYIWYGHGAEIALYRGRSKLNNTPEYPDGTVVIGEENYGPILESQWLPMTLNLYNYQNKDNIINRFCWAPVADQWWINGFIPQEDWDKKVFCNTCNTYLCQNDSHARPERPDASSMVTLGSMNFSGQTELYKALKSSRGLEEKGSNGILKERYLVFDDEDCTVWITRWGKGITVSNKTMTMN